ncbi:hypothetical protein [Caminibacter pacificus]|nr:hypothetical protein [Caminibacter pacificus]
MKDIAALVISLLITMIVLNYLKFGFVVSFIVGTILWSVLHYNLKKILKG